MSISRKQSYVGEPPNIGLQRTAPCGLAAEAGSFGAGTAFVFLMMAVFVAHISVAQSLNAGNRLIVLGPASVLLPATDKRPAWQVDIIACPDCDEVFPEDSMFLTLRQGDDATQRQRSPETSYRFTSSYGRIELAFADLTGDGIEEFILVTGQGRGTYVRDERLTILRFDGHAFVPILKTEISRHFLPFTCMWFYKVNIPAPSSLEGLRLNLDWDKSGDCAAAAKAPGALPTARQKNYVYDATADRLELSLGGQR